MTTATTRPGKTILNMTAMDVQENDIVYICGIRCRATGVEHYQPQEGIAGGLPFARYNLASEPLPNGKRLPAGCENMAFGGNKLAKVGIEKRD